MTTTRRERRERVAQAIHYYRGEWEYTVDDGNRAPVPFADSVFRGMALAQADAALEAALPDYDAFMAALKARDEVLLRYWCGDDDGNVADEAEVDATRDALIALVFGDDAQAGEV